MDNSKDAEFWANRKQQLLSREKPGVQPTHKKSDEEPVAQPANVEESQLQPELVVQVAEPVMAELQREQPQKPEKRRHERYVVRLPVHIRCSDGEVIEAAANNLSYSGIYVEYPAAADLGAVFEMMFDLRIGEDLQRVFAKARVARCIFIGNKDCYGLAFEFLSFGKSSQVHLEKYIQYRERKNHENKFF